MGKREKVVKYLVIIIIFIGLLWIIFSLTKKTIVNNDLVFKFETKNIEVKIGEKIPINYELSENIDINWESIDEDIATVNNEGMVTGVNFGNTMIKGIVKKGDNELMEVCEVSTYIGEKNTLIEDIIIPEGELFITKGDTYEVPTEHHPFNSYIKSINYSVIDSSIVLFDGAIHALNEGVTNATITINNKLSKTFAVNVVNKKIEPYFSKKIQSIDVSSENVLLKPNETKKIEFTIEPKDAFIESIKWESSNPSIASVDDNGIITAKSSGNAIVKLTINNNYTKEIKVSVSIPVNRIELKSSPKIVLKVFEKDTIKADVLPTEATNKNVRYKVSNPSLLSVDQNGIVTGLAKGSGTITVITEDGNYQAVVLFTVNPLKGVVEGDGGIWGYTTSLDKTPKRADVNFFRNLASSGKGTLSGNVFTYANYTYDILKSLLRVNNQAVYMRFYYPENTDLSSVNTFTFFGGGGERIFQGYFNSLDKDTSLMKSSGIIILIAARSDYSASDGIYATSFVKSIVNQKSGVKNTVGGYSMSGPAAGAAASDDMYSRLIIFDSHFSNVTSNNRIKNKEIIIYSPVGDDMLRYTLSTLNEMITTNYSNVTIVSNNKQIIDKYSKYYLVVNPESKLGSGHYASNITNANVYAYACR